MTTRGRLLVVFGCGGDRDRPKRPAMGEVAARLADVVVVTTDNPRSEDPAAIAEAVLGGRRAGVGHHRARPPRRHRPRAGRGRPGDVVVVAGKGHETTQDAGGDLRRLRRPRAWWPRSGPGSGAGAVTSLFLAAGVALVRRWSAPRS